MDKGKTTKILSGGAYIGKDGKRHEWRKIHGYKPKKITDDNWMEYGMPSDEETNESKNMDKKLIRLTEQDLHRIVKKSVEKVINEGNYFSHQSDEFGRDYFEEAKGYAKGIVNYLTAMEDEANSDSAEATDYLYRQLEERVIKFNQVFGLIKKLYIGRQKPMQPSILP